MDLQREEKQRYLRENILDKDYDAEEFMDYCEATRGSVDIDSWTISELKKVSHPVLQLVDDFIRSNSKAFKADPFHVELPRKDPAITIDWDATFSQTIPERKPIDLNCDDLDFLMGFGTTNPATSSTNKPVPSTLKPPASIESPIKSEDLIAAYNPANLTTNSPSAPQLPTGIKSVQIKEPVSQQSTADELRGTIPCKMFQNKPKLAGDYEIVVNGHEIVNPNIFVPNFVLYTLTTNPLNVQVKRRMKDFEMFRGILQKVFPSTQIPHLERYGRLSQTQPAIIRKQKLFIESFMNSLLMNRSLRCQIVDDFLLETNLDSLKRKFRDYERLEKPKAIEELFTVDGNAVLGLTSTNRKYSSQQFCFYDFIDPSLAKLKNLYDQLMINFANSAKILQEIVDVYDSLKENTCIVNNLFSPEDQTPALEATFEAISEMHKQWVSCMRSQNRIIETEVRHFYRFEIENLKTIRELCKQCESIVETYDKRSDKDSTSGDHYEGNKKLNEFKLFVDLPSKHTTVLRYQAAYYQQRSVDESKRYLQELSQKLVMKFKMFSVLQLNVSNDIDSAWRQFEKYAM